MVYKQIRRQLSYSQLQPQIPQCIITSVVRELQNKYKINPDRLIAAGRGEHNALVPNDTPANKSINRRTRIIIMPKLDQFYDLLSPNSIPK